MACNLTAGRSVDCKDVIGGIKSIFFTSSFCADIWREATITDGVMATAGFADWDIVDTGQVTVFKYNLRPNLSSLTVNVNSDPATGTTFFTQTLSITLQKIDSAMSNQLKLISYNRSQIFVQDQQNYVYLLGLENGCDITGGTVVTGAAKGDLSGYTMEFSAEEKLPLIHLPIYNSDTDAKFPFDGLTDESALTITTG